MAQPQQLLAAVALLALAAFAAAGSPCKEVPSVNSVDQSPTPASEWGRCVNIEKWFTGSHWCKFGKVGLWPEPPKPRAQQCLKFGRATIYRGPIYGSSPAHKAACNAVLKGSDEAAMVAVSTKYLKTFQGGWNADTGSCGKCMCIRMHGADELFNSGLQKDRAQKHLGLTFMGKVGDRCAECEDDHVDILQDRPFSWAPFDPKHAADNTWAPYVNAKDGLRGFRDPATLRSSGYSPEAVGAWTVDWQFVPCESFNHAKCGTLMKQMGYDNVWTPSFEAGVDSATLRPMATLRGSNPYSKEPWTGKKK